MMKSFCRRIYLILILSGVIQCSFLAQDKTIDSLKTAIRFQKEDTAGVETIYELALNYYSFDYDSALKYGYRSQKLANKIGYAEGEADALGLIGAVYFAKGDFSSSIKYSMQALKIDERTNNKAGMIKRVANIGIVYRKQGELNKAISYFLQGLKLSEELKNDAGVMSAYSNIGLVYDESQHFDKALEYYFKALRMAEKTNNERYQMITLANIGTIYQVQNKYDDALINYQKVVKLNEKLKELSTYISVIGNIGLIYIAKKDYAEATVYIEKALAVAREAENKQGICDNLASLGMIYMNTNRLKEAEKYFLESLKLAQEIGSLMDQKEIEEEITKFYFFTKQYKSAFEHQRNLIALNDTLFNEEKSDAITRQEMNYEFSKKEALAKSELDKQIALAAADKKKQRTVISFIICGLILTLIFAGFIFRSLQVTRKQKLIIEKQKSQVELSKHTIEEKNKEITDSINYAKLIQQSLLASKDMLDRNLGNYFILYKPKDIVSGDFYWASETPKGFLVACVDCTGHGVPGAFMSLIGKENLDKALTKTINPGEILVELNRNVRRSLNQGEDAIGNKDGMDAAVLRIEKDKVGNASVAYAGANRPLYILKRNADVIEEIKPTKNAIGGFTSNSQIFNEHSVIVNKGDTLVIATDGYADQFGGEANKKLTTKRFKELLVTVKAKHAEEQKKTLDDFFFTWKGNTNEQLDDVLVIGINI